MNYPRRVVNLLGAVGAPSALMLIASTNAAAQCAMCRTALTNSAEGQHWSRGIDHGILLLLAAPFLIVGRVLFSIYQPEIVAWLSALGERCRSFIPVLRRPAQSQFKGAPEPYNP